MKSSLRFPFAFFVKQLKSYIRFQRPTAPPNSFPIPGSKAILKKHDRTTAPLVFNRIEMQRERLKQYLSWPQNVKSLENQESFGQNAELQWFKGTAFHFQIFEGAKFQGAISIHSLNHQERSFEFGYWSDQDSEGKGYISRSLQALMKHMGNSGWKIAKIRTAHGNTKSQRVAERIGMNISKRDSSFLYFEKPI